MFMLIACNGLGIAHPYTEQGPDRGDASHKLNNISNNTIKSHLKSVYRKLDVDSRQNAVTKAQELALL